MVEKTIIILGASYAGLTIAHKQVTAPHYAVFDFEWELKANEETDY
jgi:hypothetical protein